MLSEMQVQLFLDVARDAAEATLEPVGDLMHGAGIKPKEKKRLTIKP